MTDPGRSAVPRVVTHLHDDDASHAMHEIRASPLPHPAGDQASHHPTETYQCPDCGTRVSIGTAESADDGRHA